MIRLNSATAELTSDTTSLTETLGFCPDSSTRRTYTCAAINPTNAPRTDPVIEARRLQALSDMLRLDIIPPLNWHSYV